MRIADDQISYRIPPEDRGFYELSTAIVSTAIKDYRRVVKLSHTKEIERLRKFFLSEVFENISGVENPNVFLLKLDDQINAEIRSGIRRKREKQKMICNG